MGEAKRRGTYEQRKAEAIVRNKKEAEERAVIEAARQREREEIRQSRKGKARTVALIGMATTMATCTVADEKWDRDDAI